MARLTILILILITTQLNVGFCDPVRSSIKIGVIVPLSGDMAMHGQEIRRAMELALDDAKPSSLTYNFELIFEDNQLNSAKSSAAAQKLINVDHVDAIVTLWPPAASAVVPITERSKVLHYTIVWDPDFALRNKLVLSHQVMVSDIAKKTLALLASEGKKRIAFLHLEETGFDLGATYIRKLAKTENVELVDDISFQPTENDFRSIIEKTIRNGSDCYLIWSVMPSIDILIRQIRARIPAACISGYLDYAEDLSQIQRSPYISEMFASPGFINRYRGKYGESPRSKGANAFDIMNLLIRAYESSPAEKLSAEQTKIVLTNVKDADGAVGKFSIDPAGNSSYQPVVRQANGNEREMLNVKLEDNKTEQEPYLPKK